MKLETTYENNNYPIIVEHHAIKYLDTYIKDYDKVFLIIDENVYHQFSEKINSLISKHHAEHIIIPAGEQSKIFAQYQQTIESLLSKQLTRNTCIIALGGGATGDFAGFVAATLLRGVGFIQVPTTILAHDSSVGGKVGINSQHGKNLIGAFYRPNAVIYDLDFLETLPYSEILSGYAEVYKHALLNGKEATTHIEHNFNTHDDLSSLKNLDDYLFKGIQTKLNIVVEDEKEKGTRKFLNLGHTFGHAVEYKHKIPHGHAVMIGILYQFIVANEILGTNYDVQHFIHYMQRLDYPLDIISQLNFDDTYRFMLLDKKNNKEGIQMVLLQDWGKPTVVHVDKATHIKAFHVLQSYIR
ncbi:3-dehydroquinate synthase [Staphylococcus caprae]|uniref:3-dehydroquinate synthase n=1 Tax=Staphylococcus caprae TaxID=29380 RepID=UPI003B219B98